MQSARMMNLINVEYGYIKYFNRCAYRNQRSLTTFIQIINFKILHMKKAIPILTLIILQTTLNAQCYTTVRTIGSTTIGLHTDGTLWSWGNNGNGVLGTGQTGSGVYPVTQIGTDNDWSPVYNFKSHALALKNNGTMWAWGDNSEGECGNGESGPGVNITTPQQIGTATWLDVATGVNYSLAIRSDGTLWSWGRNGSGQLGVGDITSLIFTPNQIGNQNNWAKVYTFDLTSFAIKTDGTLWSWGSGGSSNGLLGRNGNYTVPGQIGTANNWLSIAPSNMSEMGIRTDGTIWIWGGNTNRVYFGNGNVSDHDYANNPTQIGVDNDWQKLAGSTSQQDFYAIKINGTLWDWGINQYGELGDGSTTPKYFPTQLGSDNDWSCIGDLGNRIYSIKGGSLYRWGYFDNPAITVPTLYGTECILATTGFEKNHFFGIYPNPTQGKVAIHFNTEFSESELTITNTIGQTVFESDINALDGREYMLDCSAYQAGIYLIQVKSKNKCYTTKIIKD